MGALKKVTKLQVLDTTFWRDCKYSCCPNSQLAELASVTGNGAASAAPNAAIAQSTELTYYTYEEMITAHQKIYQKSPYLC